MTSAYEEFYARFKESTKPEARKAAGKGWALDHAELAAAYQQAAVLATTDEFRQMVEGFKAQKLWDYGLDPQYGMHPQARNALLDGALKSFRQGSPEKLALVMTEYAAFFGAPSATLYRAMLQGDDAGAALKLALQSGVAGKDKQAFLDASLAYAVSQNSPAIIGALLDEGADANQKNYRGFAGHLLWQAALQGAAPDTVKLLHDKGASFDDAVFMLRALNGSKEEIAKLQHYQEKVTGKTAESGLEGKLEAVLAEMLEMKREITALKKDVARLSRAPAKKALTPGKTV